MAKQKNQTKQTQKQETAQPTQQEQELQQAQELEQQVQAKNKFEERQPALSKNITLSKDRKWLIIRTIRTDIVHVNYMEKILQSGEMQ